MSWSKSVTRGHLSSSLCQKQRDLVVIFFLALALRLGFVLFFPWDMTGRRFDPQKIYQDERRYDSVATHLLAGEGFVNTSDPITVVPPIYPLFLAGIYRMVGHSFTAVRLVQAIISALTGVIIYNLGKNAFNKSVGRLAGLLAVFYPFFLVWCRVLVTETLTALLVAMGMLWLQKTAVEPSRRNRIVAGCIWGTAALVRGNMLIFFPLAILWALLEFGLNWKALGIGGSIVGVAAALLIPWTVRNYVEFRRPVLVASYGGNILYAANNPYSLPYEPYNTQKQMPEPEVAERVEGKPLIETDNYLLQRGIRYIIDHPRAFLWSAYGRLSVFWRPVTLGTVQEKLSSEAGFGRNNSFFALALRLGMPFLVVADGFVLGLTYVGMFLAVHKRPVRVLYLVVLAFCAMHLAAVVVGNGRFRLPLMPILVVFSGYAIHAVVRWPYRVVAGQKPSVLRNWIVILLLGLLLLSIGRAMGLGNELRPVEGPPYEVESFEGVIAPLNGDYAPITETGWTYYHAPYYSGGHAALTAAVDSSIQQRIDKLPPGDYKLCVTVGTHPDETSSLGEENRLEIKLNGASQILEWSNDGQDWRQLELTYHDVPAGNTVVLKSLAIGGRWLVVDKVELEKR